MRHATPKSAAGTTAAALLTIAAILGCAASTPPLQDAEQPARRAGTAACDQQRLPAQREFVNVISHITKTPEDDVRLTRLKPWPEPRPCCSEQQQEKVTQQGGDCAVQHAWTALAEARVPPTDERGRHHVGFYIYTDRCQVFHDYHYRYGWTLGKP